VARQKFGDQDEVAHGAEVAGGTLVKTGGNSERGRKQGRRVE